MRQFLVICVALVISLPVQAQVVDTARSVVLPLGITVSGSAEVTAAPDVAYITVGARTQANTAAEAASGNAAIMAKVLAAIGRAGAAKNDVQTAQYSLQPVYEYPPNASPRLTGYEATNLVRVTLRDLNKVGSVIDAASGAGGNVVQEVYFSVRDESAFRSQALGQAARDASVKASVIARAMDVRLGRLVNVNEGSPPVVIPYLARAESMKAESTPISPQQVVVRANVTATYGIGQ